MAKTQTVSDVIPNIYVLPLLCPANDGIITAMNSNYTRADKVGLLIQRIEYVVALTELQTALAVVGDQLTVGITQLYNGGVAPGLLPLGTGTRQPIIDMKHFCMGSAAGIPLPLPRDIITTEYPVGRELLAHPSAIYGFARGSSLAGTVNFYVRLFYTIKELSDDDYNELVQNVLLQDIL